MDKYELLWENLKEWVKEAYPEVLTYMLQQEKAVGLAQRAVDGEFSDGDVLDSLAFLESLLALSDASDEEKEEWLKNLQEKEGGLFDK